MGKRNRKPVEKLTYSPSAEQTHLINAAADLFASCIKPVSSQEQWDFYVGLHQAVEDFQQKQDTDCPVTEPVERLSLIPPFLQWLENHNATWNKIVLRDFDIEGLGLAATDDIMFEEPVVCVPRSAMITHEEISKKSYLKDLIEKNELLLQMPNVCLALFLHCERHNPTSKFKPYIDILPKSFTTVLYFNPDELKYLKGTSALSQAINHYQSIVRQFTLIYKLFNGPESTKPYVEKISEKARKSFTFDAYRWCVSAVCTRQNEIPMKSDHSRKTLALVPLYDMFNHHHGVMSTDFDVRSDELKNYSMSNYQKGDQVTICYGRRTHAELLIHNGFATHNELLPFNDGVSISLGVSPQDPLYYKKKLVLERLKCPISGDYTVAASVTGIPTTPPLFNFLRVFHMKSDELDKWMEMDDSEIFMHSHSKIIVLVQYDAMCKYLEDRLKLLVMVRERACGGNVDEMCLDESLSPHSRLALTYQRNEKFILQNCINQCHETRLDTEEKFKKKENEE